MGAVLDVLAKWKSEGVRLNPPALQAALAQLEVALGVSLPADVREFYSVADGMVDFEHDSRMLSLWSIARILKDGSEFAKRTPGILQELAFCDVLIDSYHYFFRVTDDRVVTIGHHLDLHDEEASLEQFLARYLIAPETLPALGSP